MGSEVREAVYTCEKCGKRLIRRLPNGLFKFVFGRYSTAIAGLADSILPKDDYLVLDDASMFKNPPYTIKVNDEIIRVGKREGNHLIELTRGCDGTRPRGHAETSIVRKVEEIYNETNAAVVMLVYGSVKMKCLRQSCGHWNIFNFFPNQSSELSPVSNDSLEKKEEA